MAKAEKGWLGHRIEQAQKEVKTWPEWMKDTARFEGTRDPQTRGAASNTKIQRKPRDK